MISQQKIESTYIELKNALADLSTVKHLSLKARMLIAKAMSEGMSSGTIYGKNDAEREAMCRKLNPGLYEEAARLLDDEVPIQLRYDLAKIDAECIHRLLWSLDHGSREGDNHDR